jgi:hypothetical protein
MAPTRVNFYERGDFARFGLTSLYRNREKFEERSKISIYRFLEEGSPKLNLSPSKREMIQDALTHSEALYKDASLASILGINVLSAMSSDHPFANEISRIEGFTLEDVFALSREELTKMASSAASRASILTKRMIVFARWALDGKLRFLEDEWLAQKNQDAMSDVFSAKTIGAARGSIGDTEAIVEAAMKVARKMRDDARELYSQEIANGDPCLRKIVSATATIPKTTDAIHISTERIERFVNDSIPEESLTPFFLIRVDAIGASYALFKSAKTNKWKILDANREASGRFRIGNVATPKLIRAPEERREDGSSLVKVIVPGATMSIHLQCGDGEVSPAQKLSESMAKADAIESFARDELPKISSPSWSETAFLDASYGFQYASSTDDFLLFFEKNPENHASHFTLDIPNLPKKVRVVITHGHLDPGPGCSCAPVGGGGGEFGGCIWTATVNNEAAEVDGDMIGRIGYEQSAVAYTLRVKHPDTPEKISLLAIAPLSGNVHSRLTALFGKARLLPNATDIISDVLTVKRRREMYDYSNHYKTLEDVFQMTDIHIRALASIQNDATGQDGVAIAMAPSRGIPIPPANLNRIAAAQRLIATNELDPYSRWVVTHPNFKDAMAEANVASDVFRVLNLGEELKQIFTRISELYTLVGDRRRSAEMKAAAIEIAKYENTPNNWRKFPHENVAPILQARSVTRIYQKLIGGKLSVDAIVGEYRASVVAEPKDPSVKIYRVSTIRREIPTISQEDAEWFVERGVIEAAELASMVATIPDASKHLTPASRTWAFHLNDLRHSMWHEGETIRWISVFREVFRCQPIDILTQRGDLGPLQWSLLFSNTEDGKHVINILFIPSEEIGIINTTQLADKISKFIIGPLSDTMDDFVSGTETAMYSSYAAKLTNGVARYLRIVAIGKPEHFAANALFLLLSVSMFQQLMQNAYENGLLLTPSGFIGPSAEGLEIRSVQDIYDAISQKSQELMQPPAQAFRDAATQRQRENIVASPVAYYSNPAVSALPLEKGDRWIVPFTEISQAVAAVMAASGERGGGAAGGGGYFRVQQQQQRNATLEIEARLDNVTPSMFYRVVDWIRANCGNARSFTQVDSYFREPRNARVENESRFVEKNSQIVARNEQYGVRFAVGIEKDLPMQSAPPKRFVSGIRTKQRTTGTLGSVKIDATFVKAEKVNNSGFPNYTSHEIEIEVSNADSLAALADMLWTVISVAQNSSYPYTLQAREAAFQTFNVSVPGIRVDTRIASKLWRVAAKERTMPQTAAGFPPVAKLRLPKIKDFTANGIGKNYIMTVKADGVPSYFCIFPNGVWLIEPPGDAAYLGPFVPALVNEDYNGTILLVERIPASERIGMPSNAKELLVPFDVVRMPPNVPLDAYSDYQQRIIFMRSFVNSITETGYLSNHLGVYIYMKNFISLGESESLDNLVQEVTNFNHAELPFKTDGLIFTPQFAFADPFDPILDFGPARGPRPRMPPLHRRVLSAYPDVLKVKPFEKLSIDFLVDQQERLVYTVSSSAPDGEVFRGDSFGAFDPRTQIDWDAVTALGVPPNARAVIEFEPRIRPRPMVGQRNGKATASAVSRVGDEKNEAATIFFVPSRLRLDKQTPNGTEIAKDVWRAIMDPITPEMLEEGNDIRFLRASFSDLKRRLLGLAVATPTIVLDLGSGRGGDVGKFAAMGDSLKSIIFVEPNLESLRELERRARGIEGDFAEKCVFYNGKAQDTDSILERLLTKISQITTPSFRLVITSMLSMSFMWESEASLVAFQNTLQRSAHLAEAHGAEITLFKYFTIDGSRVEKLFADGATEGKFGSISMRYYPEDRRVWIHIPGTIVEDQTEYLVRTRDLPLKNNFEESFDVENSYLRNYEKQFASLFVYGGGEVIPLSPQ